MKEVGIIIITITFQLFLLFPRATGLIDDSVLRKVINSEITPIETVNIGDQEWMAKNLNINKFRNGDLIPEGKSREDWIQAYRDQKPMWCYYNFDSNNQEEYGKLYNWYAVNDPRGLAPEGWYVPSNEDWEELVNYLGGYEVAGKKLKDNRIWKTDTMDIDEVGFKGVSAGKCDPNGSFSSIGEYAYWWCSSEYLVSNAWSQIIFYYDQIVRSNHHKAHGFSVRCVRD